MEREYPLLAVLPGASFDAGDAGVVETQVILNNWYSDRWSAELAADLKETALSSAAWGVRQGVLAAAGSWIVVAPASHPMVLLRLELVSWEQLDAYRRATRH